MEMTPNNRKSKFLSLSLSLSFHYVGIMVLKNGFTHISEAKDIKSAEIGSAGAISILVDREKAIEIGLFEKDFFLYLEDVDFSLRMRLRGSELLRSREGSFRLLPI